MSYFVVLAPELGVSSEEFVTAWNTSASSPVTANVIAGEESIQFIDPTITNIMIQLIGDLGIGVASNAILELIKINFPQKTDSHKLQIMQVENSDGSTLLVVTLERE